ncbi:hypothetical protein CDD80_7017 [Ophiocordyceps camponoti-rufipedis]|uniref:Ketosynthase family 3 (KS3) domain-containing protein n=1 Tax=Ophiocordyceps camponoti-rufipedis TaxID=2004952 RepID=A0A2C5XE34_9HYPO|nr:hypothetical protein CDD80_7017 [Ophiocordyceps camponoti-rufipedis]
MKIETSSQQYTGNMVTNSKTPLAIVGMSCRFPNDATSPERLWQLCAEVKNTWSHWPADRLNEETWYHPRPEHLGTVMTVKQAMDPQVRLLLETAFEAFESAGLSMEAIAGSKTSVFTGAIFHDYNDVIMADVDNLPRYASTGNGPTMIANRISHFFDLRGTSVSVDTACSTAMAALHLACQSIRSGDSEMAVVGGTNLLLHPGSSIGLSTLGFLSPSGKSYSFDDRAEGYGRGEGVGCLIIKPLEAALRDNNPIRAIVRETAMNEDGRTPAISAPSQQAQEDLIRTCYQQAGLDPRDTPVVEAHGTGTRTGDATEARAIGNVFGRNRRDDGERVIVGSLKANIGHGESASGIAAVIKAVLMLEKGLIPPLAMFDKPNTEIDFQGLGIQLATEALPWPENRARRVSVCNFGVGGSNTHAIIEDARLDFTQQ